MIVARASLRHCEEQSDVAIYDFVCNIRVLDIKCIYTNKKYYKKNINIDLKKNAERGFLFYGASFSSCGVKQGSPREHFFSYIKA